MITGNVANEPLSDLQWYQKELSGKSERIVTGNPDFVDMLPLDAFIHMMPPEQLDLMLELTNERLAVQRGSKRLPSRCCSGGLAYEC